MRLLAVSDCGLLWTVQSYNNNNSLFTHNYNIFIPQHVSEHEPNTRRSRVIFQILICCRIRSCCRSWDDSVPNILLFTRDIRIHHNSSCAKVPQAKKERKLDCVARWLARAATVLQRCRVRRVQLETLFSCISFA